MTRINLLRGAFSLRDAIMGVLRPPVPRWIVLERAGTPRGRAGRYASHYGDLVLALVIGPDPGRVNHRNVVRIAERRTCYRGVTDRCEYAIVKARMLQDAERRNEREG